MKRILSLGGGGIKGAATAAYLAHMEEASGRQVWESFDLIAGTSTGGILAIGLALGIPARELVELYVEDGPKIFPEDRHRPWYSKLLHLVRVKYDGQPLRDVLQRRLGKRLLGEAKTRLLIPSVQPDRSQMYLFKTRHHALFERDRKLAAVDVGMATAAAPSFLPPHAIPGVGTFSDGGLWANNPAGLAVVEAVSYLEWSPDELNVLSIECPQAPVAIPGGAGRDWVFGPDVLDRLGALQSSSAKGIALALMRDVGRLPRPERYFEALQGGFPKGYFDLDRVEQIQALIGVGDDEARKQENLITARFFSAPTEPFIPVA